MNKDLTEKRQLAALASGYVYIGKVNDEDIKEKHKGCDHGIYKRLTCGHTECYPLEMESTLTQELEILSTHNGENA